MMVTSMVWMCKEPLCFYKVVSVEDSFGMVGLVDSMVKKEEGMEVDPAFFESMQVSETFLYVENVLETSEGYKIEKLTFFKSSGVFEVGNVSYGFFYYYYKKETSLLVSCKSFSKKTWIPFVSSGVGVSKDYSSKSLWYKANSYFGDKLGFSYYSKKHGGFSMKAVYVQSFYKEKSSVNSSLMVGTSKWIKNTLYSGKYYKSASSYKHTSPLVKYKFPKHLYMNEVIQTQSHLGYNTYDVCMELPSMNWFTNLKQKCPQECWLYSVDEELVDNFNYGMLYNGGSEFFGFKSGLAYCSDPYQSNSESFSIYFHFKSVYYNHVYSGLFVESWKFGDMADLSFDSSLMSNSDWVGAIHLSASGSHLFLGPLSKKDISFLSSSLKVVSQVYMSVKDPFYKSHPSFLRSGSYYVLAFSGLSSFSMVPFNYDSCVLNIDFYLYSYKSLIFKLKLGWEVCYAPSPHDHLVQTAHWWWNNSNWWTYKKQLTHSMMIGQVGSEGMLENYTSISSPYGSVSDSGNYGTMGGTPYYDGVVEEMSAYFVSMGAANLSAQLYLNPSVYNVPKEGKGFKDTKLSMLFFGDVSKNVKKSLLGALLDVGEGCSYDLEEFEAHTLKEAEGEGDDF